MMKSITSYHQLLKVLLIATGTSLTVKAGRFPTSAAFVSNRNIMSQQKNMGNARRKWFVLPAVPGQEGLLEKQDSPSVNTADFLGHEFSWQEYEEAFREVVKNGRVMKKLKAEDVTSAIDYLAMDTPVFPIEFSLVNHADNPRENLKLQCQRFLEATNLTSAEYELVGRTLTYMGDYCAKRQLSAPMKVAWQKIKEIGIAPRENCLSTYLYVLSLDETSDLSAEVAEYHDMLYKPLEKTVTLRVKSFVARGDADAASELLHSIPDDRKSGEWKKLRTYLPILGLFCSRGEITSALRLYREMQNSSGVHFDSEAYANFFGALAEQGCFRKNAPAIEGVEEFGFKTASGPKLFDELVAEMADDLLEINNASAKILYNAFAKGFPDGVDSSVTPVEDEQEDLSTCNDLAEPNEVVFGRVLVNETTAICPRTSVKLQLLKLDETQRKRVHDKLIEMSAIQYKEFIATLEARYNKKMQDTEDSDYAARELSRFSQWLDEREGEPFTAIVDGPNVGYFGSGNVKYGQVEMVVEELEKMNENPVVVMPQKYVAERFNVGMGFTQILGEEDLAIMNRLLDSGKMYTVPSKCLDDYYWMLASVSDQVTSSAGVDIHVPSSNNEQRFPGLRPMLISCDQMRDHKLELLEPRLFRRWYSSFIVNFNIGCVVDGEIQPCGVPDDESEDDEREKAVAFFPADFFSREIQGNLMPEGDTTVWHFPVTEWEKHERFCIRL